MKEYDLIVIGSGAGLSVLSEGIKRGLKCALIECDKFGGTCLTKGCIPSKVLAQAADAIRSAEHAGKIGLNFSIDKPDWDLISKRMWSRIDESGDIEKNTEGIRNLNVYKGVGEFTGNRKLKVTMPDGSFTDEFTGKKIVIASGARSIIPPVKGIHQTGYVTTETFFGEKYPAKPWNSLVIIGGGIIAVELAHFFSAIGADVKIVEMNDRVLPAGEEVISDFIKLNLERHMKVFTGHKAESASSSGSMKRVKIRNTVSGETAEIEGDEIFICAGRKPNTDILKPEKCGIKTYGNGWIKTNKYLETNVDGTWAIGDVNGLYQFRHKANAEADVVIRNIFGLGAEKKAMDYSAVPWAVYTWPQVSGVGMTEKEALGKGYRVYRAVKRYSSVAKGFAMGYAEGDPDDGFVKLVLDDSLRILGAHMAGPHAEMLIQPFVYLMNSGYTCELPESARGTGKKRGGPIPGIYSEYACPGAGSVLPVYNSMIIHPSLNEVTGWIMGNLEPVNIPEHAHSH